MTDFLYPLQWTHELLEIEAARDLLELNDIDRAGSKELLVAVVDMGIPPTYKVKNGAQINSYPIPTIAGNPANKVYTTLKANGLELSVRFKVKEMPTPHFQFNNHVASVYVGTPGTLYSEKITINSVSPSNLEITSKDFSFFKFPHPIGTGIYLSKNATSMITTLDEAVNPTKMKSTLNKPSSGQFTVGEIIKIGIDKIPVANDKATLTFHRAIIEEVQQQGTNTILLTTPLWRRHDYISNTQKRVIQNDRVYGLLNALKQKYLENNDPENFAKPHHHGLAVASILAGSSFNGGIRGILPNANLMGLMLASQASGNDATVVKTLEEKNLFVLKWAAGVADFKFGSNIKGTPLIKGADIINCSQNIQAASQDLIETNIKLSKITRRGRNGRGTLCFFSAGNDNTLMNTEAYDYPRMSNSKHVFACAASSMVNKAGTAEETKASYSNYGNGIEWCAPSSMFVDRPHHPSDNYLVHALNTPGEGNIPAFDAGVTINLNADYDSTSQTAVSTLIATAEAGATSIRVATPGLFRINDWILIGTFRDTEWRQITAKSGKELTLNQALDKKHFGQGRAKLSAARSKGATTLKVNHIERFTSIDVEDLKDSWLHISSTTKSEWVQLVDTNDILNITAKTIKLKTSLQNAYSTGAQLSLEYNNKKRGDKFITLNTVAQVTKSVIIPISTSTSSVHFQAGKWVLLNNPSGDNCEPVLIREVTTISGAQPALEISAPLNDHMNGEPIIGGPNDFQNIFGGTSAATPFCSGVAGLVLSAKPSLTWLEVRHILRTTADSITIPANGFPETHEQVKDIAPDGFKNYKDKSGFNKYFGFGRLNARAAVEAALQYSHDERDLMIRNYLIDEQDQDFGDSEITSIGGAFFQSPDIWIRNNENNIGAYPDGYNNRHQHDASYHSFPPHENPKSTGTSDRLIYARIKNRGTIFPSLEDTAVRFYVYRAEHSIPFTFPLFVDDEVPVSEIAVDEKGLFFIEERALPSIAKDDHLIVKTKWNQSDLPPSGKPVNIRKRTFVLVEITPHDGIQFGDGRRLGTNNNFATREISFAQINILNHATGFLLDDTIQLSSTTTETSTPFEISINDDIGYFTPEEIFIEFQRIKINDDVEEERIHYQIYNDTIQEIRVNTVPGGSPWVDIQNFEFLPATAPLFRSHSFKINGDFRLDANFKSFRIKVILKGGGFVPRAILQQTNFEAAVIRSYENPDLNLDFLKPFLSSQKGTNVDAELQARSHFFIKGNTFNQTAAQAFGAISLTQFRTTARISFNGTKTIYAICRGQVFLQRQAGNTGKVNLILRPFQQPIPSLSIKYFIYRGLEESDFINATNHQVADRSKSAFTEYLWTDFEDFYDGQTVPAFKADYIGIPQDASIQNASDLIGQYFYKTSEVNSNTGQELAQFAYEIPIVPRGMQLGSASSEIGVDVVLNQGDFYIENDPNPFQLDLAFARRTEGLLDTSLENDLFKKKLIQESCTQFMDIAAFYGLHTYGNGKLYYDSQTDPLTSKSDIYNKLNAFTTKNNVYLYIQANRQRSYDFYGNYTITEEQDYNLKIGTKEDNLQATNFGTLDWPIQVFSEAQDGLTEMNSLCLQLVTNRNEDAALFIQNGKLKTPHSKGFISGEQLLNPEHNALTAKINLEIPAIDSNNISGIVNCVYNGKKLVADDVENQGESILLKELDYLFSLINIQNYASNSGNQLLNEQLKILSLDAPGTTTNRAVIKSKKTKDQVVSSDGTRVVNRVTFETMLFNISRAVFPALKFLATHVESQNTKHLNSEMSESVFQVMAPYTFKSITFLTGGLKVQGLVLEEENRQLPSKKILGISKKEYDELIASITNNTLTNCSFFFEDQLIETTDYFISSEEIQYKTYHLQVVGEDSIGQLKIVKPVTTIMIYSIDNQVYFSKKYTELLPEKTSVHDYLILPEPEIEL